MRPVYVKDRKHFSTRRSPVTRDGFSAMPLWVQSGAAFSHVSAATIHELSTEWKEEEALGIQEVLMWGWSPADTA